MKKSIVFIGGILLIICGMLAVIAPDKLSKAVVAVMGVFVMLGFVFGIAPLLQFIGSFRQGAGHLNDLKKINSDNLWIPLSEIKPFFGQKNLDELFDEYVEKAYEQREQGVVITDIENVINDDSISVRSWRGVVMQISGSLTALGLLGTFLGLATGIGGVSYGSLQDTVSGIETMLSGITTAFYTSIVGVILSIVFNAVYRIVWNMTLRELQLFIERFHMIVQPQADEFVKAKQYINSKEMLGYLAKIHDMQVKMLNLTNAAEEQEQRVMMELMAGVKRDEVTFCLEPVCRLSDRTVTKAEVGIRWDHEQLGFIRPERYMPVIEANGYIGKLNDDIRKKACAMMKEWYDKGLHPLPLVLRIAKSEILSSDVSESICGLINEYQLAPRDLEIAIGADAYLICKDEAVKLESELRQKGFKVSVCGFNGDFLSLPENLADEIRLDLSSLSEDDDLEEIFNHGVSRHVNMSVSSIDTAQQLAQVRKAGYEYGQGSHMYQQLSRKEFETLMKYA